MPATRHPIGRLEKASLDVARSPFPPGGEGADLLGRVRKVETDLAEWRRGAIEELEDDARGEGYELLTTWPRTYSFNWPRILRDVANALDGDGGADLLDAVLYLVRERAATLTFTVTQLRRVFATLGVPVHEANTEVDPMAGDLEEPHVGFVIRKYQRIVGRTEPS